MSYRQPQSAQTCRSVMPFPFQSRPLPVESASLTLAHLRLAASLLLRLTSGSQDTRIAATDILRLVSSDTTWPFFALEIRSRCSTDRCRPLIRSDILVRKASSWKRACCTRPRRHVNARPHIGHPNDAAGISTTLHPIPKIESSDATPPQPTCDCIATPP